MKADSIQHNGYTIEIHYMGDAQNPWTDWDGHPPIKIDAGRFDKRTYGEMDITSMISRGQIIYHQKALARIFGCDLEDAEDTDEKVDNLQDLIRSAPIEELADVCELFKIPYVHEVQSYSQSEWASILIVATDEWIKEVGIAKKHIQESLESSARLWEDYCSGDVFGYNVLDSEGNDIDSCGGFYGTDHDESGLMGYAISAIEWDIKSKKKKRFARLKELIQNNVPHYLRPQLLPQL